MWQYQYNTGGLRLYSEKVNVVLMFGITGCFRSRELQVIARVTRFYDQPDTRFRAGNINEKKGETTWSKDGIY